MIESPADTVMVVSMEVMMLRDVVTGSSQGRPDFFALFMDVVGIPDLVAVQH